MRTDEGIGKDHKVVAGITVSPTESQIRRRCPRTSRAIPAAWRRIGVGKEGEANEESEGIKRVRSEWPLLQRGGGGVGEIVGGSPGKSG